MQFVARLDEHYRRRYRHASERPSLHERNNRIEPNGPGPEQDNNPSKPARRRQQPVGYGNSPVINAAIMPPIRSDDRLSVTPADHIPSKTAVLIARLRACEISVSIFVNLPSIDVRRPVRHPIDRPRLTRSCPVSTDHVLPLHHVSRAALLPAISLAV